VADETAHLRLPGMLSFIGPALPPRFEATVLQANGNQIRITRAEEAARFQGGDQVVIQQAGSSEVATVDEVRGNLILTMVPLSTIYTGGSVRLADLARFGTPRQWIRGRLKEDGIPVDSQVNGFYLNAVWAAQVQTVNNEPLGASTGQPDQTFQFRQIPVLEGETVEVRELEGVRAEVELPILKQELQRHGVPEADIREVRNGDGRVTEAWIRWHPQPHLFFSGREDRHYVIDRVRGLLMFGDGGNGKIPPIGANNILARQYRFGGGRAGDVPAGAITQLLSGVPAVQAVTNPRPAEGGADAESIEAIKTRGPQSIRHRQRAISAQDYEALARQASPGIGVVRALPATDHSGRHVPGWVTIVILPQSLQSRPQPSFELRRRVRRYVEERAPAVVGVPHRIHVTGPDYLPVGVAATIAPIDPGEAGPVEQRTRQALEGFLHPVTGGPEGTGWAFGRDVFLSDVAALLEAVPGLDYVEELHLLVDGALQGEHVPVPPHRMVVAGDLRIKLKAAAV
jgi:Baseplate J-like protein